MKIINDFIPQRTLEAFADEYGLIMEVHERGHEVGDPARYYAHFANCDILVDGFLLSTFGNGATPEKAITDYGARISLHRIVVDAFKPTRREIQVPRIVERANSP